MKAQTKWMTALTSVVVAAGGILGYSNLTEADESSGVPSSGENSSPENVIVMIGDGLSAGPMEIARNLEGGKDTDLFMESLDDVGMMRTYSDDNAVTDSAAAGTAIATGSKTYNGGIGVDEDGDEVESILDQYQKDGKKVGVISTNTVTDATPAAFTASVSDRSGQADIARQQYEAQYDVMLGGGGDYFSAEAQDGTDLTQEFVEDGYEYVTDEESLNEAGTPDKLLGLFNDSYMNYKTDRDNVDSEEPSLEEMTSKSLDVLSQDDEGFFLMVEGARIDHAAHAADATGVWQETMEFDRTVEQVTNWAEERGDTLVLVVSDHDTMGMSMTEPMDVESLRDIDVSPEYMAQELEMDDETGTFTEESIRNVFSEYANMEISEEQVASLLERIENEEGSIRPIHEVGWEIGSLIAEEYKVGVVDSNVRSESSTGGHTGNAVPVFATGEGSESFNGVFDNTEIRNKIQEVTESGEKEENKQTMSYTDVSDSHWAFESLSWADQRGLIDGYDDGTFRPSNALTEAQFAKMLLEFYGESEVGSPDGHWADGIYNALEEKGPPLNGYTNESARNNSVTRGTVAEVLAHMNGNEYGQERAIEWMYENDITTGRVEGETETERYDADGELTRAHATEFFKALE
ncbi:alkaline phosphatase [Salibacterium lacus]|uniref:Alkaline phosphatase n=1 Tax=Salibacterium lacus TaxID=1898109 RepID=A0ABW5T4A9_9BACI